MSYIRVITEKAVLILTLDEYEKGIDRENEGVSDELVEENKYIWSNSK